MRRFFVILLALVVLVGAYSGWTLTRSLPMLLPHNVLNSLPLASPVALTWPGSGEAAVGAVGWGLLGSNGDQKPLPCASTAKLVTALSVLRQRPLTLGQQGPTLTLGQQDVGFYDSYVAEDGSVVPIDYGEQISEYQALQALLLPSANNMAESLAVWAFGSVPAYLSYANNYVKQLDLQHTSLADASGFSPQTVSTASDLVKLGIAALQNPVIAQIVSQSQADIPVAGTITNVNSLLGQDGINGIKTGNTDQAGGVYLASASYSIASHSVTIVTADIGASSLGQAMQATPALLNSARAGFVERTIIHKGDIVAFYNTPWHTSANAVATADVTSFGWKGQAVRPQLSLRPVRANEPAGKQVGSISLRQAGATQSNPVVLQQSVSPPSWEWRWLHR